MIYLYNSFPDETIFIVYYVVYLTDVLMGSNRYIVKEFDLKLGELNMKREYNRIRLNRLYFQHNLNNSNSPGSWGSEVEAMSHFLGQLDQNNLDNSNNLTRSVVYARGLYRLSLRCTFLHLHS